MVQISITTSNLVLLATWALLSSALVANQGQSKTASAAPAAAQAAQPKGALKPELRSSSKFKFRVPFFSFEGGRDDGRRGRNKPGRHQDNYKPDRDHDGEDSYNPGSNDNSGDSYNPDNTDDGNDGDSYNSEIDDFEPHRKPSNRPRRNSREGSISMKSPFMNYDARGNGRKGQGSVKMRAPFVDYSAKGDRQRGEGSFNLKVPFVNIGSERKD